MNTEKFNEAVRSIGTTESIDELNAAYNSLALALSGAVFESAPPRSEAERTLNHLTNYNIVRIANHAAEKYEASGSSDKSCLIEIGRCRDSLKEHEDMGTEQELLDSLCDRLRIN